MGRQHQEMDRPGVWQIPEGSGEQGKMEKTGCRIICGAPTTLMVKGFMMMTVDYCIGSRAITNLRFADDIDGLEREIEELAKLVE